MGRSSEELDTSRNTLQPSPLRDGKLFEPSLSWRRAGERSESRDQVICVRPTILERDSAK